MPSTLAEVLRHFGPAYLRELTLSTSQARAWRAIVSCRTPALGGQRLRCDGCGAQQWRWHSCRNRHCPQCQNRDRDAWRAARLAELLNVRYGHLVFTLPHELNALAAVHARWVYDTLMQCAAATLSEFAANPRWLGGIGAFTLVLHTWTQDLRRHLHVHALMACGALHLAGDGDGAWIEPKRSANFLFPVHALSRVFRGKFLQALQQAGDSAALPRDPADTATARQQRVQALRRHDWVVYAKTPLAGPAAVLDYLARYTHRTAIGNERLLAIAGDQVRCACAPTTPAASAPSRWTASSSSAGCCSMYCHRASSASATTGCSRRRPRPSGWPQHASCWRCRQPTRRHARTCRPSCAAWRPSRSSVARIAGSAAGASSSNAAPIARPLQRPRWPHAEGRHDAHAQTHGACMARSHIRARAFVCQVHHNGTPSRPSSPR